MRIGILSDLHAGLGRNDARLRTLQTRAMHAAFDLVTDADLDMLVLNGDTTDHLANQLSYQTSIDIAHEQLAPLAALIHERRTDMETVCIAGNADWVLASPDAHHRAIFFSATGIQPTDVSVARGALLHTEELEGAAVLLTHGHALSPKQRGHVGPMMHQDYVALLQDLREPSDDFLQTVGAVQGAHRMDFFKACAIGAMVKRTPAIVREFAVRHIGNSYTAQYERHAAQLLGVYGAQQSLHTKLLAVMGHTHVAGIRSYEGRNVLNTGTAGAKPNPLQHYSDPRGHIAIIDTNTDEVELVQTFNASRPNSAPITVERKTLSQL